MTKIIVETKLAPPKPQAGLLHRENLLVHLNEGKKRQLTLVVGPAGYGKTTLVSLWRQQLLTQSHDVAWLGLTEDDNDLSQFIAYFIASIQQVAPSVGNEALMLFNRDSLDACDAFIAALVNNIKNYRDDIYLVLDDYYQIETASVHQLLEQLMRLAPANFHLVLVSRISPPLALARLRAYGKLTEIDFAQLRLNFDEASEFIKQQGINIEAKEMRVVHELTDGWIAGLQLISITLKRNPVAKAYITTQLKQINQFSQYLESEVLSFMSAEDVDFMVKISSCGKFNTELGEALTGNPRSADIITKAQSQNLFLLPLETDDGYQWFHFHPLMKKHLKQGLMRLTADEVNQLNYNACRWFLEHDFIADAVQHAIYAADFETAADLLETCAPQMVLDGQIKTLVSWGQLIPEHILAERLELQLAILWALGLCHRTEQACKLVEQLKGAADRLSRHSLIELNLLAAGMHFLKDDTKGAMLALSEIEIFDDEPLLRIANANLLSIVHCYAGEYEKARDAQLKVRQISCYTNQFIHRVTGECIVGLSFMLQGNMAQAERICREALIAAELQTGFYSDAASLAISYLAPVLYETGHWDEARELISQRLDIIERIAHPGALIRSYMALSRIAYFSDQINEAKAYLETLEDIGHKNGLDRLVAATLHESVQLALNENNLFLAKEQLRRLNNLAKQYIGAVNCAHAEILEWAEYANIRYLYAELKWDEALLRIEDLTSLMDNCRRAPEVVRLNLLKAMILEKKGKSKNALELTEQCLRSCQRLGLVRTVLDEGSDAIALVNKVANMGNIDPNVANYIQQLQCHIDQYKIQRKGERKSKPDPLVEPLSEREMDVLQLLAKSLTNKRVALSLGISPETVKWHLKNIYGKLDVISRDEAVVIGYELNLIQSD